MTLAIILGGVRGGVFTAIEAGAVACVYAFRVTMFIYCDHRWRDLPLFIYTHLYDRDADADRLYDERLLHDGASADAHVHHGYRAIDTVIRINAMLPVLGYGRHAAVDSYRDANSATGRHHVRRRFCHFG